MSRTSRIPPGNLLYRRQFILAPQGVDMPAGWHATTLRSGGILATHPDLPVLQSRHGACTITLLGYLLDPEDHAADDAAIVARLVHALACTGSIASTIRETYGLGGRWILVIDDGTDAVLVNDAAGYRQVFYARLPDSGALWCASQPGLIAARTGLPEDPQAADFLRAISRKRGEYWWPGSRSLYAGIHHLQPNHSLDLRTGVCTRYWPLERRPPRAMDEVVQENAQLLGGMMRSAAARFDLALAMTAGIDSRILLAASREVVDRMTFVTLRYWDMPADHVDIRVPRGLLEKLGLDHQVIECPQRMSPEFEQVYVQNVSTARRAYGMIAEGLWRHYPDDRVFVKGNANPIGKATYYAKRGGPAAAVVTPKMLASVSKLGDHPFVLAAVQEWLSQAPLDAGIHPLELFFWENREGNWQAMSQLEWDLVQEVLVPYNCRRYLANLLAVDVRQRCRPHYRIFHRMIEAMWPEVLDEPVNPDERSGIIATLKDYISRAGGTRRG